MKLIDMMYVIATIACIMSRYGDQGWMLLSWMISTALFGSWRVEQETQARQHDDTDS